MIGAVRGSPIRERCASALEPAALAALPLPHRQGAPRIRGGRAIANEDQGISAARICIRQRRWRRMDERPVPAAPGSCRPTQDVPDQRGNGRFPLKRSSAAFLVPGGSRLFSADQERRRAFRPFDVARSIATTFYLGPAQRETSSWFSNLATRCGLGIPLPLTIRPLSAPMLSVTLATTA